MLCLALRIPALCDNGGGGSRLVLPCGRQDTDGLVVTGETVDSGLDENETELGVLVFAVALEVLADSDGLFIFVSGKILYSSSVLSFLQHTFLINM